MNGCLRDKNEDYITFRFVSTEYEYSMVSSIPLFLYKRFFWFRFHNQYYSRLTVSVCKHTAPLSTATSVLLLLGVLHRCSHYNFAAVPNHIPSQTAIRGISQIVEQIVRYGKKFRVPEGNASESVVSVIVKKALRFPKEDTRLTVTLYVYCLSCFFPSISQ
jgi:hypothetical protein